MLKEVKIFFWNKKLKLALLSAAILFAFAPLHSETEFRGQQEKKFKEHIHYHLLIRNYTEAAKLSSEAIEELPDSAALRHLYIESLAHLGSEKKLLRAWQDYARDFPENKYEDSLLELVAKGVLKKAEVSEPYSSKYYRYAVANSFTDASSVESLKEAMQDSNFAVRDMALNAALSHGDEVLCNEIRELLERENVPAIKLKAMEVLMRIKGEEAYPLADMMIKDPKISSQERLRLVLMRLDRQKSIPREELEKLANSLNMIERLVAGYAFGYFQRAQDIDILKQLIQDPISDVRLQAITSLGLLRATEIDGQSVQELMQPIMEGENGELALLASWVSMLAGDAQAKQKFRDFLFHTNAKLRLEATSLICYSLPHTIDLAKEFFQTHNDPYVRLNLAVQLLVQRQQIQEASDLVFTFLSKPESCRFKTCMPYPMEMIWPMSLIDEQEKMMSNVPSMVQSEIVHFCLLNLLAILEDPRASPLISRFLETHHSSIALASMPQFLRAGSGPMLDLICSFFDHPDLSKRIQAAALVALLKKEEKALKILYDAYPQVDRPLKEMIITIVGQIGAKDSIPFLTEALYEPSQSLRIIAAASLMQCLRN